ncbi:MAG: hypothetical protein ACRDE8_08790, partial [Ginsengibacter sp.]
DMEKKAKMVIDIASNTYLIISMNNYNEVMIVYNCTSGSNKLTMEFTSISKMPGDTFLFASVAGIFEDVFPCWKKYYQSRADYKKVFTSGFGKTIVTPYLNGKIISSLYKENGEWHLSNKYIQPSKTPDPATKKNI